MKIKKKKTIDLDLFFREIVSSINIIRKTPSEAINIIKESNIDLYNFEELSQFVQGKSFRTIEWDGDLTETADKYFIFHPNDYKENFKEIKQKIKEIMKDIYDFKNFDCNYLLLNPNNKNISLQFLLQWKNFSNILFGNYNLVGISGIQAKNNLMAIVIIVALFDN